LGKRKQQPPKNLKKKKISLTHNFRKGGRNAPAARRGSAAGGWQQPCDPDGSRCRWPGLPEPSEKLQPWPAVPARQFPLLSLPLLAAFEDDSEVGEARRMPFPTREETHLLPGQGAALGTDPDPKPPRSCC